MSTEVRRWSDFAGGHVLGSSQSEWKTPCEDCMTDLMIYGSGMHTTGDIVKS